MAIKWISSAWQAALRTTFPQDHRVYIDFRQRQYPEVAGSPTFTLITSADNQPGSHNFTGGYANYLLDMTSTMTLDIYFKPTFAFNVGADQYLWGWYNDATHYLSFRYDQATDSYILAWRDGGTERTMESSAYLSDLALQVWTRATFSLDLTTGTTAGSVFYLAGAAVDSTWSGNIDVKARYFPMFNVRNLSGTAGAYTVNYLRLFQSKTVTAAQVTANFSTLKEEETVWHFNGHGCGHTRCNVTSRARSLDIERTVESPAGNANANMVNMALLSPQGQFADDQYAAFVPASEIYNGTSSQAYMRQRCPVEIDTWYSGLFELEFVGRVDEDLFKRRSSYMDISQVSIGAKDGVDDMKRRVRQKAYSFDTFDLCNPTAVSSSLLHTIAKYSTEPEWYNFLANSSFENATIGNSYLVTGSGASIARVAGGLFGSWQGDLVSTSAAASIYQTVSFTGTKKLNVGQNWNLALYLKGSAAATGILSLTEYASTVSNSVNSTTWTTTGAEGWRKYEVTHAISSTTSNILRATVISSTTTATVSIDAGMLIQNKQALDWFVLNTATGATGIVSADAAISAVYDTAGFDVDEAPFTATWAVVEQGVPVWNYLLDLGDATGARYLGFDSCGTFKFRTPFKSGYADPSSILTVTAIQSVDSNVAMNQANKIIIHGVKIRKESKVTMVWSAEKSSFFDRDSAGYIYESVVNGATWPAPATYGEFWAAYEVKR